MMRPKIYLDMDGVLADLDVFMFRKYNATHDNQGHFMEKLANFVDDYGFDQLDVMPQSHVIVEFYLKWRDRCDFEILTSRGNFHPEAALIVAQKQRWLAAKFPETLALLPFNASAGGRDKARWAHPDAVLLDDTSRNVIAFLESGGYAVKYIDPAVRTALNRIADWVEMKISTDMSCDATS